MIIYLKDPVDEKLNSTLKESELIPMIVAAMKRKDKCSFIVEFYRGNDIEPNYSRDWCRISVKEDKEMEFLKRPKDTGDCVGHEIISALE